MPFMTFLLGLLKPNLIVFLVSHFDMLILPLSTSAPCLAHSLLGHFFPPGFDPVSEAWGPCWFGTGNRL